MWQSLQHIRTTPLLLIKPYYSFCTPTVRKYNFLGQKQKKNDRVSPNVDFLHFRLKSLVFDSYQFVVFA